MNYGKQRHEQHEAEEIFLAQIKKETLNFIPVEFEIMLENYKHIMTKLVTFRFDVVILKKQLKNADMNEEEKKKLERTWKNTEISLIRVERAVKIVRSQILEKLAYGK